MIDRPALPPTDDELHALVDGRLSPGRRDEVERALAHDPALAARAAAWRVQREAVGQLHRELLDDALPAEMQRLLHGGRPRAAGWLRLGGIAAGVLLAFAAGWIGNAQWSAHRGTSAALAGAPALREFVHAASVAHAVYAPEKRHPVEVAALEQQHLVQWLSKRLDRPLKVPDLRPLGFTLVGGRLLPGGNDARAQFMFEDAAGERVTLYIGRQAPDAPGARETAFRFAVDGPVPSFYWMDQGFGYAVAGKLPRDVLRQVAMLAYRDLS